MAAFETFYLRAPTLEYRFAIDRATANLEKVVGPALAMISSPFYAVEVLRRISKPIDLAGSGIEGLTAAEIETITSVKVNSIAGDGIEALAGETKYSVFLWAEPQADLATPTAAALRKLAAPDSVLNIIASTGSRRWLPGWQKEIYATFRPADTGSLPKILPAAGWRIVSQTGFHGPRAVVWTVAMRLYEQLGRPDWADRARFGMRKDYTESGWSWKQCPLALITAVPC